MSLEAAQSLAARYAAAGFPCEIEAGAVGLVVYTDSPKRAIEIGTNLANAARLRDPRSRVAGHPEYEADEVPNTAWCVTVLVDWARF